MGEVGLPMKPGIVFMNGYQEIAMTVPFPHMTDPMRQVCTGLGSPLSHKPRKD